MTDSIEELWGDASDTDLNLCSNQIMTDSVEDLWGDASDTDLNLCSTALADIEDLPVPSTEPQKRRLRHRRSILMVSDFVKQAWCEQEMEYDKVRPAIEIILEEEPVHVAMGRTIHLARELEVQKRVPVKTVCREETFAISIINIIQTIFGFLNLQMNLAREVPIFGIAFDSDIYVTGIIDELRFDPVNYEITLVELKTRTVAKLPSESHAKGYRVQALMYKYLFDNLIRNKINKKDIGLHKKLDLTKEFSSEIIEYTKGYCEPFDKPPSNLDELLDKLFIAAQPMPLISNVLIEYRNQEDNSLIDYTEVIYDEIWFSETINHYLKFWKMEREAEGVAFEDLWKCNKCNYIDKCEWRLKKHQEIMDKKRLNSLPSTSG